MKVNVTREGRYVPKWLDNREQPEGEQMFVTYTPLDGEQRKKFTHKEKPLYSIEIEGKTEEEIDEQVNEQTTKVELRIWTDDEDIAAACNPKIHLLEEDDGDPIDTWAKLLKVPQTKENQISVLVTEITAELSSLSKETDPKN